jgi:hypothetical protein
MQNRLLQAIEVIVTRLDKHHVPYMIFGGIADSIYGSPRQTFDIGIKISVPARQEQTDFIERLRAVAILLPQDPLRFIAETNVLPVTINGVRIDLVFALLPFEEQAIKRSLFKQFFSLSMKVCTVEDFILLKAVSSRQKDWDDIETVIAIQKQAIDCNYLLEHCRELSGFLSVSMILTKIRNMQ